MKNWILLSVVGFTTGLLVACTPDSKVANNVAANGLAGNCPVGSTFTNGVCVAPNGSVVNPNPVNGGLGSGARFYSENWRDHNLEINPAGTTGFISFLQKAMVVCGPYTYDSNCSAWASGAFDVVLMSDNVQTNQLIVVFRAKRYGLSPAIAPAVLPLKFTLSVSNNNQGFEARAYGDFNTPANRSLIQIQVATGKLEDASFEYRVAFEGQIIFQGRFVKCGSTDCGLSQNIGI